MKQNYDTFYNLRVKLGKTTSLLGFLLVVVFGNNSFGQLATIGAGSVSGGTNSNAGVIYRSAATSAFDYSLQYFLFTAAELSAAGIPPGSIITSLAWSKNSAFGTTSGNTTDSWKVYMRNSATVPSPTWSNGSFAIQSAGASLVYDNPSQIIPASVGWVTINLIAPFLYTGGSLEIGSDWNCSLFNGNPSTGAYSWDQDPTPSQTFGSSNSTGNPTMTLQTNRPRIQIAYSLGTVCSGMPVAGTAITSSALVCPSVPFSVSLSGSSLFSGITYQWQSSTDNVTFTNIPGATNLGFSTSQTVDTYYRCITTCTASGLSDTSTSIFVDTDSFLNCYCTSSATSATNKDIVSVSVGTLTNTSTCTSTGGPGSVTQMYSNYTNLPPVDLARGVAYPITINVDACGTTTASDVKKVYIDWNQNGLFTDPGEQVAASTIAAVGGTNSETFTFVVPLTATLGVTRMRIVMFQTTIVANVNPCGTYFNGETEDYFINVAPIPTCPQPTALLSQGTTTTTASLDWTPVGVETQWEVQYGLAGFTLGTGTVQTVNTNSDVVLTALIPFSFYDVYVRAICGPGDTSFWTPKLSFNSYGLGNFMELENNSCHPDGFIDISATGVSNPLPLDGEVGFAAPFPFFFQGTVVNSLTIGNNGVILFNTISGIVTPFNANTIGTTALTGLYPFWDDLDDSGGDIFYELQGTAPNRRFIVQWEKKHDLFLGGDSLVFQTIMEESTGKIFYQYQNSIVGSPTYDNGANATIGLRGINQNFPLSFNSSAYLSETSCVEFYYTNCPKPTNLLANFVTEEEVSLSWTAGLTNETSWTVIYGLAGFDPLTSGTTITVSSPTANIIPLVQNTIYDFYVYGNCSPMLRSNGLFISLRTLPRCANPTNVVVASAVDSLISTWNWTPTLPTVPVTNFNVKYGTGSSASITGTVVASGTNFSDTTFDASLIAGGVYQVYVQAVCGTDTSSNVGPFTVTMPLTNDDVCGAELLQVNGTEYTLNNTGATVETGEIAIAPPVTGAQTTTGWDNNSLNFTTWFKFVAPTSGQLRISGVDAGFNGQMAVYDAVSCSPIGALALVAANDDEIDGTSQAPNFTVCGLTPGVEYFLMHDSFGTSVTGVYSIRMTPISLDAGVSAAGLQVCSGDTVDLFTGISANQPNGVWEDLDGTFQIINGNFLRTAPLASGIYNFQYKLTDGCAADSAAASVQVFPKSSAGNDGAITICRNEPTNLVAGLSGTAIIGGTWFDPNNVALSNSTIITGALSIPGSYNFRYVVGNSVCPNDTAIVTINVNTGCDYLGMEEAEIKGFKVFPNPTKGVLNLQAEDLTEDVKLTLYDVNGKIVWAGEMLTNKQEQQIDLTLFERGVYILKLNNSSTTNNYRVVKN